jgi:hypothetical protein
MTENTTTENTTQPRQVTSTVKKALAGVGARLETAVGELGKLQSKGLDQASTLVETASRATHEQIAFVEQMGSEWRKLVLAAMRSATALFTPKA